METVDSSYPSRNFPPLFAMFDLLKSDFLSARDLAWRASDASVWPRTGQFADRLDYAMYGPYTSALMLAHRIAPGLLDKVAVTANHFFRAWISPQKSKFRKAVERFRRQENRYSARKKVEVIIRAGVYAMYGLAELAELAEDYDDNDGILRSQNDLRNAGINPRFTVSQELISNDRRRQITWHCVVLARGTYSAIDSITSITQI
ncbi:LA2681 family HEPN domain-containing protein [Pseudomonas rustica]|uniref:LA2681 family HEPN domain-containing protein n=1 Tax=Pseudomonas rustica TaxID=2827099 RepID=UPI003CF96A9C